jgi:hypothetical protein
MAIFLSQSTDDGDSRLLRIAQTTHADTSDIERLRTELIQKLKRLEYPQPIERSIYRHKKTFYQRLETAEALPALLEPSTLKKIYRCLLIRKIVAEDRRLADKRLSIRQYPLRFHAHLAKEVERHLDQVRSLTQKHKVPDSYLKTYFDVTENRLMHELRLLALSRWPGSRKELLSGRRDEQLTTDEAIFWRLKITLARHPFSSRFLRQLSKLISAPADVKELSNDLALYRAITRRMNKPQRFARN